MELWQRALFFTTVLGMSVCSSIQDANPHLVRIIERMDTLTQALQYQDDLLLESNNKIDDFFGMIEGQRLTLGNLSEIMNAVWTHVQRNHVAIEEFKQTVNLSFSDITSRLVAISAEVTPSRTTMPSITPPPQLEWTNTQLGDARLRLVGTPTRGRLEVYHNGQWGTVCDDDFTDALAAVFCRSMGLPCSHAKEIHNFGGGTGPIYLDDVQCSVFNDARMCSHIGWGNHNCDHEEDLGLECR